MLGNEYQALAMRTNDGKATARLANHLINTTKTCWVDCDDISIGGLFNACLGLSGEVGEFNDMVKKHIFHEKPLDELHLKKELGDVMWYVAMVAESMGWKLDDILEMNIEKLKARYPEGFDVERANNRKEGDV